MFLHQPSAGRFASLLLLLSLLQGSATAAEEVAAQAANTVEDPTSLRGSHGLLVLYTFAADDGSLVEDQAATGSPLNLHISDVGAVQWNNGSLRVHDEVLIRSESKARRVTQAIRRSGALTVEAWIEPASVDQSGPARVVTLSASSTARNLTLGQDGDQYDVRLRTKKTSNNGLPSLGTKNKSVKTRPTHVVYTRDRRGTAKIYFNGKLNRTRNVPGNLSNWDSFHLALANELDNSRPWRGTYHLVALYDRSLTPTEVKRNHEAGVDGRSAPRSTTRQVDLRVQHFETRVAPLFANHCLECHDPASRGGELDLSNKVTAFQGGESGDLLVPGNAAESLLWEYVDSDEMPKDRPPLTSTEKAAIREWIDAGAPWSLKTIDPAIYTHNSRASKNWLRRLTVSEYIETVRHALGIDIAADAKAILPADLRADGFSNTAYNLNVDLKHVDGYRQLAELIVSRLDVMEFASRFSKKLRFTDNDMGELISSLGKWLLRGPLDEQEVISFRGISTSVVANGGGFEEAIGLIIEAMLQSPRFVYRIEDQLGSGDPVPVGQFELASRLSYMLWGGPPDEELLQAAEDGNLYLATDCQRQVQRMLADPRAVEHSRRFVAEWINLPRLSNLRPNEETFPHWNESLAKDMREETLAYFHEVVWNQNRPLAHLMNAQLTFVTPQLAAHYGIPWPADAKPDRQPVQLDVSTLPSRGGLLTQGSVLTVGGDEASMVTRGLFVMHELLRGVVKDPPPCVDATPVPTKAGLSQRAIAMQRIEDKRCGGCHSKFEPLAFGLEKFDGLGHFHEEDEHGNQLRDDGEVLVPGAAKPIAYRDSAELMDLLAASERVNESLTWKLAQFALGRPLVASDAAEIDKIHRSAQQAGGTYRDVMMAIVMSDLVQMKSTEAETID